SLALAEPDAARRAAVAAEVSACEFESLEESLSWAPDFVVLATPTHLHVEQALKVARTGCPLFVEKPLTHSPAGLAELSQLVESKSIVSMVGCNLRFHSGPARVKELLEHESIGRVLFARVQTGSYLPDWRPGTDYRNSYAARAESGGGCILDCIHEIDLVRWYLSEVEQVFCMAGHLSSLEIETEDVAALICRHHGGTISEIHLDYVQRTYDRGCQIAGERGTIFWDVNAKQVRLFDASKASWTIYSEPVDWDLNHMYRDEMKHFLECVRSGSPSILPIQEAVSVMQIAFAAKASAREGRLVTVQAGVLS
ncbi:MAG TPA: Gfo/Idh/MocA family oxidoreductase, partial [Terriglobales bacterium]|nr:Gfo/Idh/MocA family oxidoreductase [Terriglobales bacterium]